MIIAKISKPLTRAFETYFNADTGETESGIQQCERAVDVVTYWR
jgi:hypothetical protein